MQTAEIIKLTKPELIDILLKAGLVYPTYVMLKRLPKDELQGMVAHYTN